MLIQTLIHINRIIILVSIIHDPFSCHNSSMPYLQRGREGWGKENEKKNTQKATKCKSFPLLTFHFPTKPFHHSIVSLQIFSVWFFSMAFGYEIKQVNWWFLQVNATLESLKCIDAVPAHSLIHHSNHQIFLVFISLDTVIKHQNALLPSYLQTHGSWTLAKLILRQQVMVIQLAACQTS